MSLSIDERGFPDRVFAAASGEEPVRAFLLALSAKARQKCITYIDLLAIAGLALRASHIKKLEGDVWELRPEYGGIEYRLFFGIDRENFVFTRAIVKKRQRTARNDIETAQRRFTEWKEAHQ